MVDISGGLQAQFDVTLRRAQAFFASGQREQAAEEYERCARLMKELVSFAISTEVQRLRVAKAKQYLELARKVRAGEVVASESKPTDNHDARARYKGAIADSSREEEDFSAEIAALIQRTKVRWDQIGGLQHTKEDIQTACALALAEAPQGVRLKASRNLLLYGPPGTGKTLLAAAASHGLAATFFSVKVSSLLSKYFGESSQMVSALFREARLHTPAVVFFDEIDSLTPSRSGNVEGPEKRVLSSLLSELDGLDTKDFQGFLLVIGATNAPWDIDHAILSRFGRLVHVPLPDAEARRAIFNIHLAGNGLACDMPPDELVHQTAGYSGRDIELLCIEAAELMVRATNPNLCHGQGRGGKALRFSVRPISTTEMKEALRRIRPKLDAEAVYRYNAWGNGRMP